MISTVKIKWTISSIVNLNINLQVTNIIRLNRSSILILVVAKK